MRAKKNDLAELDSAFAETVRSKEMANGLSIIMDARVYSGNTYFEADVVLDTQFSQEICFSEHKASQLGCKLLKRKMEAGLADGSGMTMGIRSVVSKP